MILLGRLEQDVLAIPFIMNQDQRPVLHLKPLQQLRNRRGHLRPVCRQEARGVQDKQLIVRWELSSAMPYCRIVMTLTAVIPSQSFVRTSTSATPSHKTSHNSYCVLFFFFRPCGLYHLSCFCEIVAPPQTAEQT